MRRRLPVVHPAPALMRCSIAALAAFLPVPAGAADLSCPKAIETTQKLGAPQKGWTEGTDKLPTELSGIAVFDGPPEQMADLIPDEGPKTADTVSDTWDLPPSERGYWVTCRYGNTTVTLTRQLPKSVTRCEAIFEKNQSFAGGASVARSAKCGPVQP
jgi:hypothetical protein